MTSPRSSQPTAGRSPDGGAGAVGDGAGPSDESVVRRAGRQLIFAAYGALRAVKLYPVENAAVQKALAEVTNQTKDLIGNEGELELRMSGELDRKSVV